MRSKGPPTQFLLISRPSHLISRPALILPPVAGPCVALIAAKPPNYALPPSEKTDSARGGGGRDLDCLDCAVSPFRVSRGAHFAWPRPRRFVASFRKDAGFALYRLRRFGAAGCAEHWPPGPEWAVGRVPYLCGLTWLLTYA